MPKLDPLEHNSRVEKRKEFLEYLYARHEKGGAQVRVDFSEPQTLNGLTLNDLYRLIDGELIVVLDRSSTGYSIRLSGKGVQSVEG